MAEIFKMIFTFYLWNVLIYEFILLLFCFKTYYYFETDHVFVPSELSLIGLIPLSHLEMCWTLLELLFMNGELLGEIMNRDFKEGKIEDEYSDYKE